MDALAEKRVYADRAGASTVLVAARAGLVAVSVADGRVGEFGLARACSPTDLTVGGDGHAGLLVGTESDVLFTGSAAVDELEATGFGPATAVTFADGRPLAAGPDGRLAAYDGDGWSSIGELPAPATALEGDLVGTVEGVLRLVDGELRPAGLAHVTDVAKAAGLPLVATAAGLYELGNGWLDVLEGEFSRVTGALDGRAHAVGAEGLFERVDGTWTPVDLPIDGPVAAVAYGPETVLVTADGELLLAAGDGWGRTPLGVEGVAAAGWL